MISLFALQGANYILPLITLPYLVRVLGPEKFGLLIFAQAFVQYFIVLSDYGFGFSATRDIALHQKSLQKVSEIFSSVMIIKLCLVLFGLVLGFALISLIPEFNADQSLYFATYLAAVGNAVFPVWFFQGMERMHYITWISIGARAIGVAAIFYFVQTQDDYVLAAAIQSGVLLLAALPAWVLLWKNFHIKWRRPTLSSIKTQLENGWHVFITTASINLYTTSNIFLLGLVASPATVGFFGAADKIIKALLGLINPVAQALFPYIASLSQQSRGRAVQMVSKVSTYLGISFFVISLGMFVLSDTVVALLYGTGHKETATLLAVMSFLPFLLSLATCYATLYMLGFGYKREWARIANSTVLINFTSLAALSVFLPFEYAVAVTLVVDELWMLSMSYLFWERSWRLEAARQ